MGTKMWHTICSAPYVIFTNRTELEEKRTEKIMKKKKKTHENITVVTVRFVCSKFSESVHFTFDVFFQIFAMFLPPI